MATKVTNKKAKPKRGNFYVFGSECGDDSQLTIIGTSHATEALAKTAAVTAAAKKEYYGEGLMYKTVKVFQLIGKMTVKPPEYEEVY